MGKYRHGPVHDRPKRWRAQDENRKKQQKRQTENRALIASLKK